MAKLVRVWLSPAFTAPKYWSTIRVSPPPAQAAMRPRPRMAPVPRLLIFVLPPIVVMAASPLPVSSPMRAPRGWDRLLPLLHAPRAGPSTPGGLLVQLDEADSLGISPDRGNVLGVEADDHTLFGDEHHAFVGSQELDPHHPAVAGCGLDVDEALAEI